MSKSAKAKRPAPPCVASVVIKSTAKEGDAASVVDANRRRARKQVMEKRADEDLKLKAKRDAEDLEIRRKRKKEDKAQAEWVTKHYRR
jgi:hypothetical protein